MNKKISISFVIPVYKSEKSISLVISEINKVREFNWEAILVNDNSPDKVANEIKKLIKRFPNRITYLEFRKNLGQHAAIFEGFKMADKELVATIDDDGQNPPVEILKMIKLMGENDFDVVYGAFKEKKHSCLRNIISKLNQSLSIITIGNKKLISISNVRLMKKEIVKSISNSFNYFNYIDGAIFSLTDHIGSVNVEHKNRYCDKSSYSLKKLFKLWLNHVIGYSNILIKVISLLSFLFSFLAFIVGLIYLFLTINNAERPSGWLSIYLTITLMFSVLFLIMGILAEYIGRIYIRLNQNNKIIVYKLGHA